MVCGCQSRLIDCVTGVQSVLGPLLFLVYTAEVISIPANKLIRCADDSTLIGVVTFPGIRVMQSP